jgi:benzodiazapine receptor
LQFVISADQSAAVQSTNGTSRNWLTTAAIVIVCLLVTFGAAGLGALSQPDGWYARLQRPPFAPPNWIFGPVWTTLYILMAIAAAIVWIQVGWREARLPLAIYAAQLALNAAWSPLFFGLHRPDLALIDIVLIWVGILVTMWAFARHSRLAAALLVPYLAWVSFATYLNAGFWWLNR